MSKKTTYKSSGVDIKKANQFVGSIQSIVKKTTARGVIAKEGSFGSLFQLDKKYRNPILVSSTDGVGTKLLIAKNLDKHDTVGIDLVAMNVNDILCVGAKPLFFLDYIACGELKPGLLKKVMRGIADGCRQSGCALIGGETAEMPGMYSPGEYDLAGFAVGVVEKNRMITRAKIARGNILIGLASSGLHSNGFSLVRKVFSKKEQRVFEKELLMPTRIYVGPVLKLLEQFDIRGIAHITGGAFYEKLTKIIPQGKCCSVDQRAWPVPEIFKVIKKRGKISQAEMFTVFNMGIGMVLVVDKKDVVSIQKKLFEENQKCWVIGEIIHHKSKRIIL